MPKPTADELEIIRQIYLAVLEEPWFNRNAVTEREFLKVVIHVCVGAGGNPDALAQLCRDQARLRFSCPD